MTWIARSLGIIALALLALGLATVSGFGPADLQARLSARPEDGSWAIVSMDGRRLPPARYVLGIRAGRVWSGDDGCNNWAFKGPEDSRTMMTTLQACPANPVTDAYWAIARSDAPVLLGDGALRISGGGHVAILRRCQWRDVRRISRDADSISRECILQ